MGKLNPNNATSESIAESPKMKSLVKRVLRETIALTVWLYVFLKIFVYDVDLLLVNRVPLLQQLYPFKFFLLLGFLAIAWLTIGGKRIWKLCAYVGVYPFILFWRLIKYIFKNWALFFVFVPAIESIILTLKWRFVLGSFTLLAALAISLSDAQPILIPCMTFLLIYLSYHYILRLRTAFRSTTIFADIAPTIEGMWRHSIKTYKGKEFNARSGPDAKPEDYPKKHIENIKELYTTNLIYNHLAKKLDIAVSSRRTDAYFVVALVYSFILTVVIFAFEYLALFKLEPASFQNVKPPHFWLFLLFSFNALLHTSFTSIAAVSGLAIALANLELLASMVIGLCLVFVLLTSSRERYRQDVRIVAEKLLITAKEIERFIDKKLHMRLMDVEVKIIEAEPHFTALMVSFGRKPPSMENGPKSLPP